MMDMFRHVLCSFVVTFALVSPLVEAKPKGFVEGSLLFHSRNSDLLEDAILSGNIWSRERIRDTTGLGPIEMEALQQVVRVMGGEVRGVSLLNDWMHIRLPESIVEPSGQLLEAGEFLNDTLVHLADKLNRYDASVDQRKYENVVHTVAAALRIANLEHLVSLLDLVIHPVGESMPDKDVASKSEYQQTKGSSISRNILQSLPTDFGAVFYNPPSPLAGGKAVPRWYLTNPSLAQAANSLTAWASQISFVVRCVNEETGEPFYAGEDEATPECLKGYQYEISPADGSAEPEVFEFQGTNNLFRITCDQAPADLCEGIRNVNSIDPNLISGSTIIYTAIFNETAATGVNYKNPLDTFLFAFSSNTSTDLMKPLEGIPTLWKFVDGDKATEIPGLQPIILNRFQANGPSLRALYGVAPSVQGNKDQVLSTTLQVASGSAAVNLTAQTEYLSWFGIDDAIPLVIKGLLGEQNNVSKLCPWPNNNSKFPANADCSEAEVDVQTLQVIAPHATTVFYPTEQSQNFPTDFLQSWMKWWDAWDAQETTPDVLSISWTDDYKVMGPYYKELEERLKKTVAAGISIIVSSGDGGASGIHPSGCYPADNPLIGNYPNETWPAGSPWVTAVGSTMMRPIGGKLTETVASSENGCWRFTSGGGFTGLWFNQSTPDWQKKHVEIYLRENNATTFDRFPTNNTPGYNPGGRGFPDLVAYGDLFPSTAIPAVGVDSLYGAAGTSYSAPLVGALFGLANEKLTESGYRKIGYANPMLYWMAEQCTEAFTDIVDGNNVFSGYSGVNSPEGTTYECLYGFPAAPGWDPASGLGSINFEPFVACAKRYQDEVGPGPSSTPKPNLIPQMSESISRKPSVLMIAGLLTTLIGLLSA